MSLTLHYLHGPGGSLSLQQVHNNNQSSSGNLGFGSSNVPYSTNLATYPRDIYEVMLNPLPFNAHGFGQLVAAPRTWSSSA